MAEAQTFLIMEGIILRYRQAQRKDKAQPTVSSPPDRKVDESTASKVNQRTATWVINQQKVQNRKPRTSKQQP